MSARRNETRDRRMVTDRLLDRLSYAELGRRYGVSTQRARQIIYKQSREFRTARPTLTKRAKNIVASAFWWQDNRYSDHAEERWLAMTENDLYMPTPHEIEEKRLHPLDFLRLPGCGRATMDEIYDWMHSHGMWKDYANPRTP